MSRSDLDEIQGQLRQAIQNHQILVARMKSDPQNATLQKQLHDLQSKITALSEKQKVIVQQLRKELDPKQDSENTPVTAPTRKPTTTTSTINVSKPASPSVVPTTVVSSKKSCHFQKPHSKRKEMRSSSPIRVPSYPLRPSLLQGHKTNVMGQGGDYLQKTPSVSSVKQISDSEKTARESKPSVFKRELPVGEKQKFEFMAALDLVSPDTVKELQSKRTERKKRSTANPHFACGNYDSERKQAFSDYLTSIGVKRPRGRLPKASPNTSRPGSPDSEDSGAYRNGYRNGNTDVDNHDDFCAVCHRSGQLLMCDTCNLVFHLHCLEPPLTSVPQGLWSCQRCVLEGRRPTQHQHTQAIPASLEMVHSYIAEKAGKEEEKRKLLKRKSELSTEKAHLESKSRQLTQSINKQSDDKGRLMLMNNNSQASVDKIKEFVHVFQS